MGDGDCDCGQDGCCDCSSANCNPCAIELPECCSAPSCNCFNCCSDDNDSCRIELPECCSAPSCNCFNCCHDSSSLADVTSVGNNNATYYILCIDTTRCDPCCNWSYKQKKYKSEDRQANNVSSFKSNNATDSRAAPPAPEQQTMYREAKPNEYRSTLALV